MTEPLTGLLVIAPGPASNEEWPLLGQLEEALGIRVHLVPVSSLEQGLQDSLISGIRTLVGVGVRRLVLVSLLPMTVDSHSPLYAGIQKVSRRWPFLAFHAAAPLDWQEWGRLVSAMGDPQPYSPLLDLVTSRCHAALQDESLLAPSWDKVLAEVARNANGNRRGHGHPLTSSEEADLRALERRINDLLPPQYQGRYEEVCPTSMGSAALKCDADGKVAWDEIWTSFCDLALAGGPPHRGILLEAVTADEALAEPDQYQKVVSEIERGIQMVTGLPIAPGKVPGWVGVQCQSEDMAVWLMRAIIVENVMVRREGSVIYLPAGPRFTLKREIKNVVTVVAKTVHYWRAHLTSRRQPQAG